MKIEVAFSEEGLFGSWPPDERAGVNVDESKRRFAQEVQRVVSQQFPGAQITVAETDGLDSVTVDGHADSEDAMWAREAAAEIYNDGHFWATEAGGL